MISTPLVLAWAIKTILTGLLLGFGFYLKETLVVQASNWRALVRENLDEGRCRWSGVTDEESRFFNPAIKIRQETRREMYDTMSSERAMRMAQTPFPS